MCVENKQNYNGFIDICKFFMSILIVLGHYSYIIGQEFENVQIELNGIMGWCNVLLAPLVGVFFVISGWLIANNYSTKIEMGQVDFVDFMRERIKRIVPFAWFASTLFVVADLLYRLVYGHWWAGRSISISDAIMHFSETYVWIGGSRDINGPVWYISVLLFCYILFFVISRFVPEKYKICLYCFMILLGTYICLGGGSKIIFLSSSMGRGYYAFFFGVVCAYCCKKVSNNIIKRILLIDILVIVFAEILSLVGISDIWGDLKIVCTFMAAPIVVMGGERYKSFFKGWRRSLAKWLGNLSFSIYLLHIPIFVWINLVFFDKIDYEDGSMVCAILFVVIVISVLSQKIVALFLSGKEWGSAVLKSTNSK